MMINVPQYIDVEDKIVGPLTAKQLGLFIGLGIILLILWSMLPLPVLFVIALPLVVLTVALAFYRPYGQPLGKFLLFGLFYFLRPKVYVWKRSPQVILQAPQKKETTVTYVPTEKKITAESLNDLAQMLDSEGEKYNAGLEEILKKQPTKKN